MIIRKRFENGKKVTRCQARCDIKVTMSLTTEASPPGASLFLFSAQKPSSVISISKTFCTFASVF